MRCSQNRTHCSGVSERKRELSALTVLLFRYKVQWSAKVSSDSRAGMCLGIPLVINLVEISVCDRSHAVMDSTEFALTVVDGFDLVTVQVAYAPKMEEVARPHVRAVIASNELRISSFVSCPRCHWAWRRLLHRMRKYTKRGFAWPTELFEPPAVAKQTAELCPRPSKRWQNIEFLWESLVVLAHTHLSTRTSLGRARCLTDESSCERRAPECSDECSAKAMLDKCCVAWPPPLSKDDEQHVLLLRDVYRDEVEQRWKERFQSDSSRWDGPHEDMLCVGNSGRASLPRNRWGRQSDTVLRAEPVVVPPVESYTSGFKRWLGAIMAVMKDDLERIRAKATRPCRIKMRAPVINHAGRDDVVLHVARCAMEYMYEVQRDIETNWGGWNIVCKLRSAGKGMLRGDLRARCPNGTLIRSFAALEAYVLEGAQQTRRRRRRRRHARLADEDLLSAGNAEQADEHDDASDADLCDYERQRRENMARNNAMLRAMGLDETSPAMSGKRFRARTARNLARTEHAGRSSARLKDLRLKDLRQKSAAAAAATRCSVISMGEFNIASAPVAASPASVACAPATRPSVAAAADGGAAAVPSTLVGELPAPPSSTLPLSQPQSPVEAMPEEEKEMMPEDLVALFGDLVGCSDDRWEGDDSSNLVELFSLEELMDLMDDETSVEAGEHLAAAPTAESVEAGMSTPLEKEDKTDVERSSRARSGYVGVKVTQTGKFQAQLAASAHTGVPQLGLGTFATAHEAAVVLARVKSDLRNGKMLCDVVKRQRQPKERHNEEEKKKAHAERCAVAQECSEATAQQQGADVPLTATNAVGRRVLVPRSVWPTYSCTERGGDGWEAKVLRVRHGWATVSFAYDTDEHGRRVANEQLPLKLLQPLVPGRCGVARSTSSQACPPLSEEEVTQKGQADGGFQGESQGQGGPKLVD